MKKDSMPAAEQNENKSGVPVQLKLMLGVLALALVALVLKMTGVV